MNSSILNYIVVGSLGFILGFFSFNYYSNSEDKKNGESVLLEQIHQTNKEEEVKIDSLETINKSIEVKKARIQNKREVINKNYEKDTTYINSLEFDTLVVLFLKHYPR